MIYGVMAGSSPTARQEKNMLTALSQKLSCLIPGVQSSPVIPIQSFGGPVTVSLRSWLDAATCLRSSPRKRTGSFGVMAIRRKTPTFRLSLIIIDRSPTLFVIGRAIDQGAEASFV